MASSHAPARRRIPTALLVALAAAGGVALAPLPAAAEPGGPATSSEAAALVAARAHDLEVVTEEFNEARERLAAGRAAATEAADRVTAAEAALATAQDRVRAVARGAWTADRLGPLSAMLTSDSPGELLDRVGTLQTIADHNSAVLDGAEQAGAEAAAARTAAEEAAAAAQSLVDRVRAQQADLTAQIARFQAEYDRLAADEQRAAQEAAERHAAEERAAADRAAERAAAARADEEPASRSERDAEPAAREPAPEPRVGEAPTAPAAPAPAPAPAPAGGGSAAAQRAVQTAMAQLGDAYVWAAAGPDAFDCSGLTQYAYAAAGIDLPHSSRMQSTMGTPVARSALQPGDLVFFYSPVSHVGLYIGDGQMVHASTFGQPVKVASVDGMGGYVGARRVG